MYKKIVIFMFLIMGSFIFAENLGTNIILDDAIFYYEGNNENILDLKDDTIKEYQDVLMKYKSFYDLDITKLFESNYAISFHKRKDEKKFFIYKKIETADFVGTKFYNNKFFERDIISGMTTYYILGDNQFIYSYDSGNLYISNDIALYFEMLDNLKKEKHTLRKDKNFVNLLNYNKEYKYKYYLLQSKPIEKNGYVIKKYSEINGEKRIKRYLVDNLSEKEEDNINLADLISGDVDRIYIGKNIQGVTSLLNDDFKIMNYTVSKELLNYLNTNIKLAVYIEKGKDFYILLLPKENFDNSIELLRKEYEKVFFYDKKLKLLKNEYGYEIHIPILQIDRYIDVYKNKYLILSNSSEVLKNIEIGKYYNYDYSKINLQSTIYKDFINNIDESFEVKNNIIEEIE
ncbi:hypothetical protein [Haliovirga abyssi]|uniref:Uncharacterized protein n=1 Tax=Haliovirga abyssi TaxID=2996794 RepID=A0AAU9DUR0_9FUSO|nr:hypothetical protein [Haliovirga abyssi]BDU49756.1 hypothetical protein HLVA_03250 [Haliovirga abyssi]